MRAELRRNRTVIRYWEKSGEPREHRIPKGEDPETYLKAWIEERAAPAPSAIYDVLRAELVNYDRRATRNTYKVAVKLASRWNPSGVWTRKKTAEFARWLLAEGYTTKSISTYLTGLRSLFEWAATNGDLTGDNPFRCKLRLPENSPNRFEPLTNDQLAAVKEELKNDAEALNLVGIVEFGFIRPGELEKLDDSHFDAAAKTIHVPAAVAKNRTARTVSYPVNYEFRALKEPLNAVRLRVHRAFERVGIKTGDGGSSLYSVKHTSAKRLYAASGFNLSTVKSQAGHKSITATEKYTDRLRTNPTPELVRAGW